MLGHRDHVGTGNLCHGDIRVTRCFQIHMIASHSGSDGKFQIRRLFDSAACEISRPERLADDHGGVAQLLLNSLVVPSLSLVTTYSTPRSARNSVRPRAPAVLPRTFGLPSAGGSYS
eukprot:319545_1